MKILGTYSLPRSNTPNQPAQFWLPKESIIFNIDYFNHNDSKYIWDPYSRPVTLAPIPRTVSNIIRVSKPISSWYLINYFVSSWEGINIFHFLFVEGESKYLRLWIRIKISRGKPLNINNMKNESNMFARYICIPPYLILSCSNIYRRGAKNVWHARAHITNLKCPSIQYWLNISARDSNN